MTFNSSNKYSVFCLVDFGKKTLLICSLEITVSKNEDGTMIYESSLIFKESIIGLMIDAPYRGLYTKNSN